MAPSATAAPRTRVHFLHRRVSRPACLLILFFLYSTTSVVAQVTVESKSAPLFIINDKAARNHLANYVAYTVTNTSGAAYSDLTVSLTNFQGSIVSLGNNEDGSYALGALANGDSATVFFYLKASAESAVEQSHDVEVHETATRIQTSDTTFTFVLTSGFDPVHTALAASANKVDSVRITGTPTVGGTYVMTVYGRTGVIGAPGDVLFSPATYPEWPANTYQLESSVISIGDPVSLTITDELYPNLLGISQNEPYTLVYTFRVNGTTSGTTASSPLSYLASGQKIKHEDIDPTYDTLPVELVLFEAVVDGPDVLLSWNTASETNNAGFEIQRLSSNGDEDWTVLGWVEGYGTIERPQSYTYRVEALDPGRHVFRLKQIDFDGTFEYHPEVEVVVEMVERFLVEPVYPNPFNPETQFRFAVWQTQPVRVDLYDMLGRRVKVVYEGVPVAGQMRVVRIDGSDLPSGMYVVRVAGASFVKAQTVTLIK